jgi:TRAP-type C4-dicarboxylate transport system permease small subunit
MTGETKRPGHGFGPPAHLRVHEDISEKLCLWLCQIAVIALIGFTVSEVVARGLFGFSFGVSDEIGGYLVVMITFLSLSVCETGDVYHRVDFLQARLPGWARAGSRLFFDLLCFLSGMILLWQTTRLVYISWDIDEIAPTILGTPLWIPRLAMPLGSAAVSWALFKAMRRDVRWLRLELAGEVRR